MILSNGMHTVHYETVRYEKLTGEVWDSEYSGKGATHKIHAFPNGYGLSIANGFFTFDMDETALIKFRNTVKLRKSRKKRHRKKLIKQLGGFTLVNDIERFDNQSDVDKEIHKVSKLKRGSY